MDRDVHQSGIRYHTFDRDPRRTADVPLGDLVVIEGDDLVIAIGEGAFSRLDVEVGPGARTHSW